MEYAISLELYKYVQADSEYLVQSLLSISWRILRFRRKCAQG